MSARFSSICLVALVGTLAFTAGMKSATADDESIRAFHSKIPQSAIVDLRRRLAATRWPDHETVTDSSQGVPLERLQELVRYWGTGYDWHKVEARINAFPQFVTTVDGVDIHFIHVRSKISLR
jgi:Epoxide hydrolase N terminus